MGGSLKPIRKIFCLVLLLVGSGAVIFLTGQSGSVMHDQNPKYLKIARSLLSEGLQHQLTFSLLQDITSTGPRLSGSPGAAAAIKTTRRIMQELGFEAVHLEPTEVPHWVRGPQAESFLVSHQSGTHNLAIAAIGGSIATPESGISGQVIEVRSFQELRARAEEAKGRVIFYNRPMNPSRLDTFAAYGEAADQRTQGAVEASQVGAVAVVVRSLTLKLDNVPHTGMLSYAEGVSRIPAACVSTQGAERLSAILKQDPEARIFLKFQCRTLEPVDSYNVVGQITGQEKPQEIVLLGGHLDCWDLGHGAHDDGAGCAQSLAALKLIKNLGLKPKRTIRAVMFMNEEFGGTGGQDYASAPERAHEIHLAALESDRGGFLPLRLDIGLDPERFKTFRKWEPLFQSIGIPAFQRGGGGVDINPLGAQGTILCGLIPDAQRYFDVHHSAEDVIGSIHPRELELGTIALALFAYIIAQEGI